MLGQYGLNSTQFTALRLLEKSSGMSPSDLTQQLLLEKSSVSRMVDRLVQEELVTREPDAQDRRMQRLTLSDKGQQVLAKAHQAHSRSLDERLSTLTPHEHDLITTLLAKLSRHLRYQLNPDPSSQESEHGAT